MPNTTPSAPHLARAYHLIARYRGAVELGWYDFISRFRRSYFGPLWATFQLALWISSLGLVFHEALGEGFGDYLIYLGLGFYAWEFLSSSLVEGPTHFTSQTSLIRNIPTDISYLTIRKIAFLVFRTLFQMPVPIMLILLFGNPINPALLLLYVPFSILLIFFSYTCLVILGLIGARIRDARFLVPSLVRFLFFTSPIIWRGDAGIRKTISTYNPISYFLELARAPVEGRMPSLQAWVIVCTISLGGFLLAIWMQTVFRNRLIYSL